MGVGACAQGALSRRGPAASLARTASMQRKDGNSNCINITQVAPPNRGRLGEGGGGSQVPRHFDDGVCDAILTPPCF